jgi:hypothetical protein
VPIEVSLPSGFFSRPSSRNFPQTRNADLPFVSIPKGETGSQRQAVKPGPARRCSRVSINSPAWANRSPDRALSKRDSDQSTSEGNPLVAKEKTGSGLLWILVSALGYEGIQEYQEGQSAKDAANRMKPAPSLQKTARFF